MVRVSYYLLNINLKGYKTSTTIAVLIWKTNVVKKNISKAQYRNLNDEVILTYKD